MEGENPTTNQRNKILNNVLVKLQPPASVGAEGTPELLLRDFTRHPALPRHYHPITAAEPREVGSSSPAHPGCNKQLLLVENPPFPAAELGSPPPSRGSLAAQHPAGGLSLPWPSRVVQGRGAWAASVSPSAAVSV